MTLRFPVSMRFKAIPRPLFGVAVAVALVAGACSSEQATETQASADTETTANADAVTQSPAAESDIDAAGPESPDEPADSGAEAVAPSSHLFPDLNTVTIADGATVNLAEELAGGDTPVLLWFWAPH